ncbi:MAG: AraC family transcriptional regulator of adaptative response [Polaribacter sp.]|jgi:AraC family transcriptional regulator of adaptative response/methylated-DNA-[protein]-cysteine methyltransferase
MQSKLISLPSKNEMYKALCNKDVAYEGVFVAAIKTTGIFCRSTCTARKPKEINCEFYADCQQALSFGYRPCRICKPQQPLGETPDWIKSLLKEIASSENFRIKDWQLKERGIEPTTLRRWFNTHHKMTFQAYLRSLRLNQAIGLIKHQAKVTQTAMDSGYGSLSGFSEAFKKLTGVSPIASKTQNIITINRIVSPLGPMIIGATEKGICLLEFFDRPMLETQLKRLTKWHNAQFMTGESPFFIQLNQEVKLYFQRLLTEFKVPLDILGTNFQNSVWKALKTIPFGETRSYQQQAIMIGNAKAVRAVASANGDNRIAIIIPCHRVIGKNGQLTGYGGGLWRKQRLLELERR